eukprot:TRINITY_DN19999_c0_g1_i3.p1 TRINITY_DN19999_c0_g1~~TRINITY_DN19999_c0_g1_i3.p1  ORF type:complete len:110 (+),score=11.58 TRINITY_DN19999_c0_g1_i3:225-554(+)
MKGGEETRKRKGYMKLTFHRRKGGAVLLIGLYLCIIPIENPTPKYQEPDCVPNNSSNENPNVERHDSKHHKISQVHPGPVQDTKIKFLDACSLQKTRYSLVRREQISMR